MEVEGSFTITDVADVSKAFEIVVNTFHMYHGLLFAVYGERLVFNAFTCDIDNIKLLYLLNDRVISLARLTCCRHDCHLWIKSCKESGNEVTEAIEDTEHHDHSHGGNGDAYHRYCRDDVDDISALLREKIATRYV